MSDASYYANKKSIAGVIVLLANKENNNVSPLHWKSHTITRVCQSSKDAETRACEEALDHAVMVSRMLELMLFGSTGRKLVEVRGNTDSEPLIRTLGSTKRISSKCVIPNVKRLKEMLRDKDVKIIRYLNTTRNLSDILTKMKSFSMEFSEVFRRGFLEREKNSRVEIRLIPRMTGDELRIFRHGVEEKAEMVKDPESIT